MIISPKIDLGGVWLQYGHSWHIYSLSPVPSPNFAYDFPRNSEFGIQENVKKLGSKMCFINGRSNELSVRHQIPLDFTVQNTYQIVHTQKKTVYSI